MNVSCVYSMVCGGYQVSTNIVSFDRVQLTEVCTNPRCLSSSVGLRTIALQKRVSQLCTQEKIA